MLKGETFTVNQGETSFEGRVISGCPHGRAMERSTGANGRIGVQGTGLLACNDHCQEAISGDPGNHPGKESGDLVWEDWIIRSYLV